MSPRQMEIRTRLAHARLSAGLTQEELARMTGISIASYARLERGLIRNPPLGWLVNASFVLGFYFDELVEDEMRKWQPLNNIRRPPPSDWRDRPDVRERAERFRREQEQGE